MATYHIQPNGSVKVACVGCQELTPIWGATTIRLGKWTRIPNPRFMMPRADGFLDDREWIRIPKIVAKGIGCESCGREFISETLKHGNKAFLEVL